MPEIDAKQPTAVEIGNEIHRHIEEAMAKGFAENQSIGHADERGIVMQSLDQMHATIRVDHAYIDMWKRAFRTQRDFINTIWSRRCIRTRRRLRGHR